MATSANVIEYTIYDKYGKIAGYHRHHLLCVHNIKPLFAFVPAENYTIQAHGYDEEEEYWENEPENLKVWLDRNKRFAKND